MTPADGDAVLRGQAHDGPGAAHDIGEAYRERLRATTRVGLVRQFAKGRSTGGRTFGYRTEPVYERGGPVDPRGTPVAVGYRRIVDDDEAEIVRHIFQLYASGDSERSIAAKLEYGPAPRGWRPNTISLMLCNALYVGRPVFNRREWYRHPETGRRMYRLRPEAEWSVRIDEALRIVPEDVWNAVVARRSGRSRLFARRRSNTRHLLSGLLVCATCEGTVSIVRKDDYGCSQQAQSGTCSNTLSINRTALEQIVIASLARRLPARLAVSRGRHLAPDGGRVLAEADAAGRLRQARNLTEQAMRVMAAIATGELDGLAQTAALRRYQHLLENADRFKREADEHTPDRPSQAAAYDEIALDTFAPYLLDVLGADVALGREFVQAVVANIRIADTGPRDAKCPLCARPLAMLTPQHVGTHGVTLSECHARYPHLGFTRRAMLTIALVPDSLGAAGGEPIIVPVGDIPVASHRYLTDGPAPG